MAPEIYRPSATMRPAIDADAFLVEMCGIVERGFQGSGYAGAVRSVHARLPNMPPSPVVPYTDWLIQKLIV